MLRCVLVVLRELLLLTELSLDLYNLVQLGQLGHNYVLFVLEATVLTVALVVVAMVSLVRWMALTRKHMRCGQSCITVLSTILIIPSYTVLMISSRAAIRRIRQFLNSPNATQSTLSNSYDRLKYELGIQSTVSMLKLFLIRPFVVLVCVAALLVNGRHWLWPLVLNSVQYFVLAMFLWWERTRQHLPLKVRLLKELQRRMREAEPQTSKMSKEQDFQDDEQEQQEEEQDEPSATQAFSNN